VKVTIGGKISFDTDTARVCFQGHLALLEDRAQQLRRIAREMEMQADAIETHVAIFRDSIE
jgi:hypothetical protein